MSARSGSQIGGLVGHVDRLVAGLAPCSSPGRPRRTGAAGAVLDVDLQRVARLREAARVDRRRSEARRRAVQRALVVELGADHAVRADEAAVAALDADLRLPDRHDLGDVALLPLRRCRSGRCRRSGSALTGSSSPRPAIIIAVTCCTNAGASSGTSGGRAAPSAACVGTSTSCRCASAASTAAKFLAHDLARPSCRRSSRSRP